MSWNLHNNAEQILNLNTWHYNIGFEYIIDIMRLYMKEKLKAKMSILCYYINKNGNIPLGHSARATTIS